MKWRVSEGHRPDRLRDRRPRGRGRAAPAGRRRSGGAPARHGPGRHRRRGDLPQQGPVDVGHAGSGLRHGPVPGLQRLGVGDLRARSTTACRRRPRSPPAISRARSPRCSAWPSSASACSRCRASRSGARTTSITRTTTCRCSTRSGPCIQDANLPITFHVSTGRDPRAARGNGGAVINYVSHSLSPTIEPVANLCASGVFERFPRLRFATIEAGIGWVAWFARRHGRGLPQAPLLGAAEAQAAAERVLPRARLRVVPGGPGGPRAGRAHAPRRQLHVGQRLPASRGHLAALGRGHRADDGRISSEAARAKCSASTRRASSASRCRRVGDDPGPREPPATVRGRHGAATGAHRAAGRVMDILELVVRTRDGLALRELSAQLEAPEEQPAPAAAHPDRPGLPRAGRRSASTGSARRRSSWGWARPPIARGRRSPGPRSGS